MMERVLETRQERILLVLVELRRVVTLLVVMLEVVRLGPNVCRHSKRHSLIRIQKLGMFEGNGYLLFR